MNKNDSVNCAGCGKEFEMTLVAMVRRRPMWCDECIGFADERLQEAAGRAEKVQPIPEGQ